MSIAEFRGCDHLCVAEVTKDANGIGDYGPEASWILYYLNVSLLTADHSSFRLLGMHGQGNGCHLAAVILQQDRRHFITAGR